MSINTDKAGFPIAEFKTLGRYSKSELIYFDPKDEWDDDGINALTLEKNDKGNFEVVPPTLNDHDQRSVYFASGKSGSGKSTFAIAVLEQFRKSGIKHIFVITEQPDRRFGKVKYIDINDFVQPNINENYETEKRNYEREKIKFKHIKKLLEPEDALKEELRIADLKPLPQQKKKGYKLVYTVPDLEMIFKNSVVFFDDYEESVDKAQIEILRDHLLTQGRHYGCNMIICNHLMNGGHDFKLIKAETTDYVIFKMSEEHARESLFKRYIGFKKRKRDMINKLLQRSRWVCYNTTNHYLISERAVINMDTV